MYGDNYFGVYVRRKGESKGKFYYPEHDSDDLGSISMLTREFSDSITDMMVNNKCIVYTFGNGTKRNEVKVSNTVWNQCFSSNGFMKEGKPLGYTEGTPEYSKLYLIDHTKKFHISMAENMAESYIPVYQGASYGINTNPLILLTAVGVINKNTVRNGKYVGSCAGDTFEFSYNPIEGYEKLNIVF